MLSLIKILKYDYFNYLLLVCTHPHIKMREWGVEALCNLGKYSFMILIISVMVLK